MTSSGMLLLLSQISVEEIDGEWKNEVPDFRFFQNNFPPYITLCLSGMKDLTLSHEERGLRAARLKLSYDKLMGKNATYASGFFFMEILNLVNIISQIFLTDMFLMGRFLNYGTRVAYHVRDLEIGGSDWNWNPMDEVFPKMTSCQFNKHGVGGGIQVRVDLSCNMILYVALPHRTTMPCAYCLSTLSTRRSTSSCGSGTSSWLCSALWPSSTGYPASSSPGSGSSSSGGLTTTGTWWPISVGTDRLLQIILAGFYAIMINYSVRRLVPAQTDGEECGGGHL